MSMMSVGPTTVTCWCNQHHCCTKLPTRLYINIICNVLTY